MSSLISIARMMIAMAIWHRMMMAMAIWQGDKWPAINWWKHRGAVEESSGADIPLKYTIYTTYTKYTKYTVYTIYAIQERKDKSSGTAVPVKYRIGTIQERKKQRGKHSGG